MKFTLRSSEEIDYYVAGRIVKFCVSKYRSGQAKITLGLATGRTFEGIYEKLSELINCEEFMLSRFQMNHQETRNMLSRLELYGLDEYKGVAPDDVNSYAYYYQTRVVEPLGLRPDQMHVPRDESYLVGVHIELQLLGIGVNGHIGFCEPGSFANSRTQLVDLAPETIEINRTLWDDPEKMPSQAFSMGIYDILGADEILMVAKGATKAPIIGKLAYGNGATRDIPASVLELHSTVMAVIDPLAGTEIGLVT